MLTSSIVQVISCANRNDSLEAAIDIGLAYDLGQRALFTMEMVKCSIRLPVPCTIDNLNVLSLCIFGAISIVQYCATIAQYYI